MSPLKKPGFLPDFMPATRLQKSGFWLVMIFCNYPGDCHFDEWSEEKSASRERFLPSVEMTPE